MRARPGLRVCWGLAAAFAGCAGSMSKPPLQGLTGTFLTYGPAADGTDCPSLKTQFQRDSCRRESERMIEEPFQGSLIIRNLDTREKVERPFDVTGSYHAVLEPGHYEICINDECSDPIEVRLGAFSTYGQRRPRPATQEKAAAGETPQKP